MSADRDHIAWMLEMGESREAIEEWIRGHVDNVDRPAARANLRELLQVSKSQSDPDPADLARRDALARGRNRQRAEADVKRATVGRLAGEGFTQGQVATRTGYSRKTVYRYWPKRPEKV